MQLIVLRDMSTQAQEDQLPPQARLRGFELQFQVKLNQQLKPLGLTCLEAQCKLKDSRTITDAWSMRAGTATYLEAWLLNWRMFFVCWSPLMPLTPSYVTPCFPSNLTNPSQVFAKFMQLHKQHLKHKE